ncbi:hypothetical protein A5791_25505 [Mycobacterium sp. 852002-51163_SCH5372311]|nr:hypothetical protein A5791_25505 [Mycobacterium sp. 852002-51163_SCH5372311]
MLLPGRVRVRTVFGTSALAGHVASSSTHLVDKIWFTATLRGLPLVARRATLARGIELTAFGVKPRLSV